jgi:serine protease AprX
VGQQFGKAVWGAMVALALCAPAFAAPHRDHGHRLVQAPGKLDAALRSKGSSDGSQSVIVTVKEGTKADVLKRLESHGGKAQKDHAIINAFTARVDAAGLAGLVGDPDVDHIAADADVVPNSAPSSADTTSVVSNLKQTLALGNWFSGSTLTVAVIDSGIAPSADFSGRIVGTYDFTNGQPGVAIAPADQYGHGTHVAGLIGSSGATSGGVYAGVAPGIKFLSLRVLNNQGGGKTSDVIAALQFAVANRSLFGIRIINLSLGHPIYESALTDPLVQAVEAAVRAGIVVVVAAGNYGTNPKTGIAGYAGVASPGNSPSAITVGAASNAGTLDRTDDRVAPYSGRGPSWFDGYAKPDVVAPGQGLLSDEVDGSTLATTYPSLVYPSVSGKLLKLSGSSMATGVVSGLVAVMIEAHDYSAQQRYNSLAGKIRKVTPYVAPPALTPNAIKAMLQYSATPLRNASGVRYDALTQGAGEVDGLGALTLAYYADTSQAVGTAWMTSVTPTTQFGTDVETWSQQIVWGTRLVAGGGLMEINQPAWQKVVAWGSGELDNIVWGTTTEEDNIVWGTSAVLPDVVWAGSVTEGDNIVWGTALDAWGPNIVWGTALLGVLEDDNIVWGTSSSDGEGDNIVWGTVAEFDNIVWGTVEYDNVVWGTSKVTSCQQVGGVQ